MTSNVINYLENSEVSFTDKLATVLYVGDDGMFIIKDNNTIYKFNYKSNNNTYEWTDRLPDVNDRIIISVDDGEIQEVKLITEQCIRKNIV